MLRPLLIVLSIACAAYTYLYFGEAFPITSLSISADRHAVHAAARDLRSTLNGTTALVRPAAEHREASSFTLDSACQHFVELRGGGNRAFAALLNEGLYAPFTWRVRHFQPGDAAESVFFFRPNGSLFGFATSLPEDEQAANLTAEAALELATTTAAAAPWHIDFGAWRLVEQQKEAKPRRADHTFTFERAEKVGDAAGEEASYRLALRVSGAQLAALRPSFKVPESFTRAFDGMRSANEALAQVAWIGIVVLYGIVGVVGGSWHLLRRNALAAKSALPWSALLAGGMGCAVAVQLPLNWMSYSTEVDVRVFLLDLAVKVAVNTAFLLAIAYLSLVAAEGLGRLAFPTQLRLWALMRLEVLASAEALQQVALGYLLVPVMFAYEVSFYFICSRLLGWWTPSSPLADPDVNATLAPWVFCIAQALFAGFWEEALFRALPLAVAQLATAQRRKLVRGVGIGCAFLVQAAVFGAAHANYPAQPAHARLVELLLPSCGFGYLYWRWGLLPGVVLHYLYDVVWMALPIFLGANAPDKALVLLCAALPLLAVVGARCHLCITRPSAPAAPAAPKKHRSTGAGAATGKGTDPLEPHRNAAWTPRVAAVSSNPSRPQPQPQMPVAEAAGVAVAGGVALVVWLVWLVHAAAPSAHTPCSSWADALPPSAQAGALERAGTFKTASGANAAPRLLELVSKDAAAGAAALPAGALQAFPRLRSARTAWLQHRFVWAEQRDAYTPLLRDGFLRGNEWHVRYARIGENATLAATAGAEEWLVTGIAPHGGAAAGACAAAHAGSMHHKLPEARAGAHMSEADARTAAHRALSTVSVAVVDVADEAAVSSSSTAACATVHESDNKAIAHPNRTDYAFNFSCVGDGFGLAAVGAEARFGVRVGAGEDGPLVLELSQFVKVPEEWLRSDKTRQKVCGLVQLVARVMLLLALGVAAVRGVLAWSAAKGGEASGAMARGFFKAGAALLLLRGASAANKMALFHFELATSQPYTNQLVSHLGSTVGGLAMQAVVLGLAALSLAAPPGDDTPAQSDLFGHSSLGTHAVRLAAGAGAGVVLCAVRTGLAVQLSDATYEPPLVDAAAWMGHSLQLELVASELLHVSMRTLLGCLLSRALHALTPPAPRSRLRLLLSPCAWLLCLCAGTLLPTKDVAEGAACALVNALPLAAAASAAAIMAVQLAVFHHHVQLVPVAAAAHGLLDLGRLLSLDASAESEPARLCVLGTSAAVLAVAARLCAALKAGVPVRKKKE